MDQYKILSLMVRYNREKFFTENFEKSKAHYVYKNYKQKNHHIEW